ncbi:outer membrane lipoprotein LolB [Shewanella aestuarii]|uniref:Outer-membrane lipoprotein LolB n=2 Tax=Shewanella aestuarii TaxID=1028752 RepID=A0A6G9QNW3_9GAMM|nr:lipoprotein insertase outer membrane protein LolB [Shewanella aestuarii]QIR16098.1 outer membrane lipoprotein LolB [Shewanella aestuarii]
MAICIILLFSACTSLPSPTYQPVEVSDASLANNWEIQGKISIKSSSDKFSTNLYWFHHTQGNELRLTTVLGTNVLTLKNTQGMASLEVDGKTYHDRDAQNLLEGISGITIPFNKLPLWITGQISSNDDVVSYNSQGKVKQLISTDEQADWIVEFISWQQQSGAMVPKQLKIERADVQIKIQTNQWQALTPQLTTGK